MRNRCYTTGTRVRTWKLDFNSNVEGGRRGFRVEFEPLGRCQVRRRRGRDASGSALPHVMMSQLRFIWVYLGLRDTFEWGFCWDRKSDIYIPFFSPSVANFQPSLLNYACFPAPTLQGTPTSFELSERHISASIGFRGNSALPDSPTLSSSQWLHILNSPLGSSWLRNTSNQKYPES